jgi:hypothetical protein
MTIGEVLDVIEVESQLVADRQVVTVIRAVRADQRMSGVLIETYDALGRVEHATPSTQTTGHAAQRKGSDASRPRAITAPNQARHPQRVKTRVAPHRSRHPCRSPIRRLQHEVW